MLDLDLLRDGLAGLGCSLLLYLIYRAWIKLRVTLDDLDSIKALDDYSEDDEC
jgi:hypothetical protein